MTTGTGAVARPPLVTVLTAGLIAVVSVLGVLGVLSTVVLSSGPRAAVVGLALALLPVLPVVAAFLWLDRFEAEPSWLLVGAFGWGAGVATAVALVVNTAASFALDGGGGGPGVASTTVVAPVVEETMKGLGVVVVLVLRRREFDGVVDGIVYAGMVGIGFACVENVLYFSTAALQDGATGLAAVFVLRAVLSPFAHPLFTMATGLGIGLAVSRRGWWWAPVVGLAVAMSLHGLWNTTAMRPDFLADYVAWQVPLFAGAVLVALVARRREGRVIGRRLGLYAAAGWLTPAEVAMVASLPERRRAREWARSVGGRPAARAMADFQDLASELAFLRERMDRGTAPQDAAQVEASLLRSLWVLRRQFLPTSAPGRPHASLETAHPAGGAGPG